MADPIKIKFTTSVMLCETRMLTIAPWCAFKFTLVDKNATPLFKIEKNN